MHCLLHLAPHELATLGYTDLSLLSETDAFRIIRAYTHDKQAVLIKAPVSSDPSAKLIHQLEHEFAITSDLNTEYVVRPGKIERGTSLTALILEDCACQPLSSLLKAPLEIDYFLTLAMGITTALAEIHRGGLVHKDITPANIFVTADGRVKLSGFGFASRLSRERPTLAHLQEIAGTLAYMAPEQTGRMNRSIDTRSDLYSLGVVFYQMLTGQLPFNASDPMGWVHCHIAIQPISPQQQLSTIPAPLSKIVMKLLAKAAEERYQTAEGLKIDLQRCHDEWLEGESIEPFELGMQDICNHLVIPEKLYGRGHEVKSLLSAVDRVVDNGNLEILLVSGYAGIGKSALINEIRRSMVSPKVLYAEGKYDQFKRDIPYATLTQALQALVRHILGRGKEEIAQWRDDLNNAIKPNARLVTDLVPDLVRLIGEQPAVAKVPPQEAQNRFHHVIRRLIEVFARPEHPLVLLLDDLQWLDNASLQLLEHLLTQSGLKHLLVLGAYRDNEVGQTHPLRRTVQVLNNREVRLSEIILKPLAIDHVCRLIVDTIHTDEERVLPLADLVLKKTGGNPFFVNQFLTSMAEENLLAFDSEAKEWTWNLDAIRAKGYSENVVDLMLQKLGGLPDETQQALKRLACLGTDTEIDTLAALSDQSETALHTALWGAVKVGLVLRDKASYRFLHDRVQETAYALIPEQDRPQLHLTIGRQLVSNPPSGKLDDTLFDVVNHLNRGAGLMTDPAEVIQLAELNAAAGRKARSSIAYATARELFSIAAAILSEDAWSNRYDFQFALYSDWAEAEFLCGDYAHAESLFETLLTRAASDLDRVGVYMLRMHCYPTAGRFDDALVAGIEALRLLGQSVPDDAGAVSQAIASEAETLEEYLQTHSIDDMPQAPEVTDVRARIMIDLLTGIAGPAYIGNRPELYPLFAYMNLNIIFQYGVSKEACHAFSAYALLQASSLGDLNAAYESSQTAISLSERFGESGVLGSVLYLHGNHVNFWLNPFSSDFPILERGFNACIDGGNLAFANYIGYSIVWQAIERGDALAGVLEFSNKYTGFAQDSGNEPIRQSIVLEQQFVKCLMGKTDGALSFSDEAIDESASAAVIGKGGFTCGLAYYHSLKMLVAYLLGDDTAAHSHALEARQLHSSVLSQPMQAMFHFLDGLVLARSCNAADDEQREKTLQTLAEHAQKLAFWADNAPANFACKHALVAAQIALLQRDTLSAEQLFERACETARTNNFIHWQAMASEAAARFYADRGLQTIARAYLHEALDCYARWGASAKVRQLQQQHTWLQPIQASPPGSLNHQLDTAALLEASQKLSGEVELGKLIKALMTLTLESAGADRGLLLLGRDRVYEVEVEATAVDADIQIKQLRTPINQIECAESVVNRVINTHQNILIDNTANPGEYSTDPYFQQMDAKCICCIPLLRQDELTGVLYLENSHTPGVFTHQRTAVLDLLATQAAISLENANLYQNIKESENEYHNLVETVQAAIVVHTADTQIIAANPMAQNLLGLSEAQLLGKNSTDSDWHFLREDGSIMPVEEYPVNQVLATDRALHNIIVGVDRPDREEPMWAMVSALPVFDETHSITRVIVSFSDITERKKSEQQLVASEQLFRTLVENSPDHIARYDLNLRRVYINPVLEKTFKVPRDQALRKTSEVSSPLLDPVSYMANLRKVIASGKEVADQIAYRTPQDEIHWASCRFAPEFDSHGKVQSVLVISNEITKQKLAELEQQEHTHFLESLDRINRVLQEEGNIEQIMNKALDEVLDIFACDRVYLLYPCDPYSSYWSIPMERTKPEYPGVLELGIDMPMNELVAWEVKLVLDTEHPVRVGPGTEYPVAEFLQKDFNIRSFMAMALHPRVDKPWQLGIHQCSYDRVWSDQELRLFEEIGHRISDGLNDLLITRNLRENEERFRLVYENSPVSIWEEDFSAVKSRLDELTQSNGADLEAYLDAHPEITKELVGLVRIVNINNATLELHEADSKEALLEGLPKTFIPESYDAFRKQLIALWRGETELRVDGAVQTLRGKRREVSVSFSVCPGYEQSLSKVFVSLFDITQRKQDEDGLRLAASVFSTSQEGILISDADNCIIDINPAFTSLTGYSREEALGQNPGFLSAGRQDQAFYAEMWQSINTTGEWQGELLNRRKSGEVFPELLSIVAVRDEQGQLQHYVGAFSDISVIKQHEADLDRIAHYDMLTSVPNRRLLGDRLDQAIAYTRRHGKSLAVCYLDLDGFKPINDQFGHEGGDHMLVEIARRLESMSRGEDTVARLGGDEFVLLWNNIETEEDCMRALERILAKVAEPMLLEDQPVSVSASIGVTLYPDDDVDADSLLRHADHAMYTAKQLGKNCYKLFDARLERQISAQAELLSMIERGLDRGQFELYYQPKLDYTAGKVVGVEALLRWNDPILGLLGPAEFLSLIVNDSLAFRMGRWVLEEAICQAKIWDDMGITIPISINIFPRHLKFSSFIDDLRSAIESHWPQMPKHRLLIEIIESSDLEELEPIEMIIRECVELGIGFSLDDFGTGYSSLVYLRRLSIEELKIDQSFVRDMLDDPEDEAIVVGVISLGQAFGLRVVAEGVETSQQAEYLVGLGCPIVQGYGLGRPMPPRAFQKWYTGIYANKLKIWQK
ncbi:EAL domain-containing protein [Candidatus Thiodiazotropha sp. CDECU1]|uniref:EAL domain-containing protein n=1 Tax=Candidatus Thiodiazotropha sp. CDECU1 TaxID=3065865 RepID=UPI00292CD680|nr:EAL domain-containing protein [Candidatus Thiodiazotropha sp. CDECU1]